MRRFLVVLLLFSAILFAQETSRLDSLLSIMPNTYKEEKVDIMNQISKEFWFIDPQQTIDYGHQAFDLAKTIRYDFGKGQALNNIGVGYYFLNDLEKALLFFQRSLKIREKIGEPKDIVSSLNNISVIYSDWHDNEKSLEYLKKILEMYERQDDKIEIANSLLNIGVVYENMRNFDKALEYLLRSLKVYEDIEDDEGIASAYSNIGIIFKDLSNYEKAIEHHLKSLEIREKIGDYNGVSNALNNIGIIYDELKNYDKALEYYQLALKQSEALENHDKTANVLNNIGVIFDELKEYDKALEYYQQALTKFKKIDDRYGISNTLNNIGVVYENKALYAKALEYYQQSLEINKTIHYEKGIAASYSNIGSIYLLMDNEEKALEYLLASIDIAKKIDLKDLIIESYEKISKLYSKQKNFKAALQYYKKFATLKDSIFTKESIKEISGLQTTYEVQRLMEKQEKEIELLQKDNEIYRLEAEKQKLTRSRFYFAIIVLVILTFLAYYRYQLKKRANVLLDQLVKEKTKDLQETNEKLTLEITERKKLEAQLRIRERLAGIGELAAGVAHEIRNPIAIMKSTAQYCKTKYKQSDAEINELMDIFIESSDKVNTTVKSLLEFARPQKSEMKQRDLKDIVEKMIQFVENKCAAHNVRIVTHFHRHVPLITLNLPQVEGALVNLILNAIDAMPKGGVINISIHKKHNMALLSVKDNGTGISEEHLHKIFNPFFTTKSKGTGLGLNLVYQTMNFHQGKVEIISTENEGTTATLYFPIN